MKSDTSEAIDLSAFLPQDTRVFEVDKPDGDPSGWMVTLAGPAHPQTLEFNEAMLRKTLRRQQQIEAQQLNGRKVKPEDRSPEDIRRENIEGTVARIVTWTPVKIGGETFDFTRENAIRLLSRHEMRWVYVQIIEAIQDEKSFSKASAAA